MTKNAIEISRLTDGPSDPLRFDVVVRDDAGETRHRVSMSMQAFERLTSGLWTAEQCLDATFRFLLDHEPKEAILARFDVSVISLYFPEFQRELPKYLGRD